MNLPDIKQKLQAFSNPAFVFNEAAHTYHLGERPLLAFSTWIKDFVEPFDELKIAGFSASKRGCTVQEVLDEWEWARQLGTTTHALIERFYTNPDEPLPFLEHQNAEAMERYAKFVAIYSNRLIDLKPLGLELQVFNEVAGLCGTIDFLGQHTPSGKLYVVDYKTNKLLTMNNDVGRYTKRMRGKLCDLWDNHETKYNLQVSYYRLILEEAGIPTAGGVLIHLPPGSGPAKMISCTDYRARLRSLLFN